MAWYAELKRRHWHRINDMDAIAAYRKERYDAWYASLTPRQIADIKEQQRLDEERSLRSLQNLLFGTVKIMGMLASHSNDRYPDYIGPFGKPIYDAFGNVDPDAFIPDNDVIDVTPEETEDEET